MSVKLQRAGPKRRARSAATQPASSVGSIVDAPPSSPYRRVTAATVAAGEWPAMAPVSPRQKSMKALPSMSVSRAPWASAKQMGNPPGHMRIQVIGTPPRRFVPPVPKACPDRAWRWP
ncbi:MAG TPA: hypothetical protein VK162_02785 [Streptosporangiaceae bacterium]|nr:hypothetical protein [Streptosporangiaceae bacterium]